jgi:hypothetical protein
MVILKDPCIMNPILTITTGVKLGSRLRIASARLDKQDTGNGRALDSTFNDEWSIIQMTFHHPDKLHVILQCNLVASFAMLPVLPH